MLCKDVGRWRGVVFLNDRSYFTPLIRILSGGVIGLLALYNEKVSVHKHNTFLVQHIALNTIVLAHGSVVAGMESHGRDCHARSLQKYISVCVRLYC